MSLRTPTKLGDQSVSYVDAVATYSTDRDYGLSPIYLQFFESFRSHQIWDCKTVH